MITAEKFFGGQHAQTLPSPPTILTVTPRFARMWTLRAGSAGMHVLLEDPSVEWLRLRAGCPHLLIYNAGSNDFDVELEDSTVVCTVVVGEAAEINVASSASRAWGSSLSDLYWQPRARYRNT